MRKYKRSKRGTGGGGRLWQVFQAALLACFAALAMLLITTLMLAQGWIKEGSITLINTVLKILGALFAGSLTARKATEKPWLWGGLAGVTFQTLAVVSMCLLVGEFPFSWGLIGDMLMSAAVGGSSAQLIAMMKKSKSNP
ncbi:MAG: TIGR04086 family membrane protein [Clostridia bacterium]|nr:TIGR04086 family membrane protein [Clostridia bacterium]